MVVVHVFPFLTMDAASLRRHLTLVGAAKALLNEGSPVLGCAVALFTMVTPLVLAGGMLYVCGPLLFGRLAPGGLQVAKWMHQSEPWNMVEVFLLGVLVSLLLLKCHQAGLFLSGNSTFGTFFLEGGAVGAAAQLPVMADRVAHGLRLFAGELCGERRVLQLCRHALLDDEGYHGQAGPERSAQRRSGQLDGKRYTRLVADLTLGPESIVRVGGS